MRMSIETNSHVYQLVHFNAHEIVFYLVTLGSQILTRLTSPTATLDFVHIDQPWACLPERFMSPLKSRRTGVQLSIFVRHAMFNQSAVKFNHNTTVRLLLK